MTQFNGDLDSILLKFPREFGEDFWRIYHSFESVLIMGGVGSGKTTSSASTMLMKYMVAGYGGLILTVKADEIDLIKSYCEKTGRSEDLIVIEPKGKYTFDFLKYLSTHENEGTSNVANIVETLKIILKASEEKSRGSSSSDPFWENSLRHLLNYIIQLTMMAYGSVSVVKLYEILLSLPKATSNNQNDKKTKQTAFEIAFKKARVKVLADNDTWKKAQPFERLHKLQQSGELEEIGEDEVPSVRVFKYMDIFFFETFKNLAQKTRSIVEFNFSEFLYSLLQEPFYSMFCRGGINVKPEDCLEGKIIVLNIPVKLYHKVGRDTQTLFKYLFQTAMEKRDITKNDRPIFLYADEFQNFIVETDTDFQTTSRGSRVSSIYITQNISNLHAAMGGQHSEHRVKSLLGVFGTKIFHANTHIETNAWASELIGDAVFFDPSRSITTAENFSRSDSVGLKIDRQVRHEHLVGLNTGGKRNNYVVDAYIHVQGDKIFNGENFRRVKFKQIFK